MKFIEEGKNCEIKDNLENMSELDKLKQNSSTTNRSISQNNLTSMIDESEENKIKKSNDEKVPAKNEENNKRTLAPNEFPFINYSKKRKTTSNYIRLRKFEVLPRNDIYEATDHDIEFLNNFNNQNNDMTPISYEIYEQLVVLWELNSEKDYPISFPQARSLIAEKIEKTLFNKIEDVYNVH